MKSAITISLVAEARGGPFVFWDDLAAGFAAAAQHGFDAVEVFPPHANAVSIGETRALMEKFSLKIAAVGTGAGWVKHKLRLTDPDPAVRARAREFIYGIINLAGYLGAPAIIGSMQGRWEGAVSREQALDWLAEELKALSERAAAHQQVLLYEPLNRYETNLLNRNADAVAFVTQRGLKNVKLLCDLYHMNIEEQNLAESLRQTISTPSARTAARTRSNAARVRESRSFHPAVSIRIKRCGLDGSGALSGPKRPGYPGSPPARCAISIATCHMSTGDPACTPIALWL